MATWDDLHRIALALPETIERYRRDRPAYWVRDRGFAWERPLRPADLAVLGDTAQDGPVLAARVADLGEKQALLAEDPDVFFTTPHFDGYPVILISLDRIGVARLNELIEESWLAHAPKRLAREYLAGR